MSFGASPGDLVQLILSSVGLGIPWRHPHGVRPTGASAPQCTKGFKITFSMMPQMLAFSTGLQPLRLHPRSLPAPVHRLPPPHLLPLQHLLPRPFLLLPQPQQPPAAARHRLPLLQQLKQWPRQPRALQQLLKRREPLSLHPLLKLLPLLPSLLLLPVRIGSLSKLGLCPLVCNTITDNTCEYCHMTPVG